jgi:hypothetical protein
MNEEEQRLKNFSAFRLAVTDAELKEIMSGFKPTMWTASILFIIIAIACYFWV